MDKVLLIDKPKEWTSFDVVAKIRGILRSLQPQNQSTESVLEKVKPPKIRVGHAGTLDPLATGLLVILVGKATKRQDDYMKKDKVYEVTVRLGSTSNTGDDEGEKTHVSDDIPSLDEVRKTILQFIGKIHQIPPAYSAIKIDGQRAYKLARAGKDVQIKPRGVTIYSIEQIEYEYPILTFTTIVSSGTYIRSLVTDIGERLRVGAYMSDLRRTQIGDFDVADAMTIDQMTPEHLSSVILGQ
ncbi:MAG: tRNA pseudouridine55 synthase [Patescibacteria group bacterium]|nr:tRNA pseudouridine55 synthase [Patescibacteria group bacterium]